MRLPRIKDYPREWLFGDDLWTLKFVRKIDGNENILGLCDPSELVIYIKTKQTRLEMLMSTMHEIFHGLEHSYDICFDNKPIYTYRTFHSYIYKMEKALALTFLQNSDNFLKLFSAMK
jgi:hypothetical protein